MNRFEYMRRLEELLSDIAPSEKEEALTYYNDYFNDAGEADEQQVMEELGTPEQVAAVVKEGLGFGSADGQNVADSQTAPVTEGSAQMQQPAPGAPQQQTSYQGQTAQGATRQHTSYQGQPAPGASQQQASYQQQTAQPQKKGMPAWAITLIVIGLVFCSPVILALLCVVLALILAAFSVMFGLILGFAATSLALYIAAIVCILLGLFIFPVSRLLTGALLGTGFLAAAFGILFMLLTVLLCSAVPALCKGTAWLWRKLFHKR